MNYLEEILKTLNESLIKETDKKRRQEIADIIKIVTEESLYAAAIYDFLTLASSGNIGGLSIYYNIPEVRKAFYDKLTNPNIGNQKKDIFFGIIDLFTDKLLPDTFKSDPDFIPFIKKSNFETCKRLFEGDNTFQLLNEKEYYDLIIEKSKDDERYISILPYNELSLNDNNYLKIMQDDLRGNKIFAASEEIQAKILNLFIEKENADFDRIFLNFLKLTDLGQQVIIKNKSYVEKFIKYTASNEYSESKIPIEHEVTIIYNNLDYINSLSFKEKYNFIIKMKSSELQKYLIEQMHFTKNLISLKNFYKFFDYIKDENFLVECLTEKHIIENIEFRDLIKIIKKLDSDYIKKLFTNENFKNKFENLKRFEKIEVISQLGEDRIDNFIENNENLPLEDYIKFFNATKNHKYIEKVIEELKKELLNQNENTHEKIQNFLGSQILESYYNDNILSLLTNEEFEFFLHIYDQQPKSVFNAANRLSNATTLDNLTAYEKEILNAENPNEILAAEQLKVIAKQRNGLIKRNEIKEALKFINTIEERVIDSINYSILEELSIEERTIFLNHTTYACLLENIASCDIILDYCYDLLKENPNLFNEITPKEKSYVNHCGDNLSEESLKRLKDIYKSLNEKNKEKILNITLLKDEEILVEIQKKISADVNSISGKMYKLVITEILTDDQLKNILINLDFENLKEYFDTINFSSSRLELEKEVLIIRQSEIIKAANNVSDDKFKHYGYSSLIKKILLESTDKKSILEQLEPNLIIDQYNSFQSRKEEREINDLIFEFLKEKPEHLLSIDEDKIKEILSELNKKKINELIEKLDLNQIISLFAKSKNKELEDKLISEFNKKTYFINDTDYTIEELISRLEVYNKENIYSKINSQFDELNIPFNIKDKLRKSSLDEKMFLISGIKEGLLTEEKLKHISNLLNKDPFALNSLKIQLFNPEIYNISKNIIDKIYRYENLTLSYIDILLKKDNYTLVMLLLLEYLEKTTISENLFANKMNCVIKYLSHTKDELIENFINKSITEEELQALEEYIMKNTNDYWIDGNIFFQKETKENIYNAKSFVEYEQKRISELDKKVLEVKENEHITILDCIFEKYFKISLSQALSIINRYDTSLNSIEEYIENKEILDLYRQIKNITLKTDINEIKHIYFEEMINHDLDEIIVLFEEFTKAYNLSIANNIKGYSNGQKTNINIPNITEVTEVIEVDSDFELIVHSTDAYGSMQMINDNYFESWNYSERTANHGICTSFISASNLGTANVKGKGVMFGFNKLNEKSITLMAPYDIVSRNDDFLTTSRKPPMFVNPKDLADYTRHTHNELVLERRNVSEDSEYPVIQPDFIVIFEEMPEEIKQNSLKAQEDFKAQGINLPIIYINRHKVVKKEAARVNEMLNIFESTGDLKILYEIINKYESNRCGLDFEKGINIFELFQKDRIYNDIINAIKEIKNNKNITRARDIIDIIEYENDKFQLIIDQNPERAHRFDLYDEKLKEEIQILKEMLELEKENNSINYKF